MAQFVIYRGLDRLFRWRLKAANGEIICWAEGYTSKDNAKKSINFVKTYASSAEVEELD